MFTMHRLTVPALSLLCLTTFPLATPAAAGEERTPGVWRNPGNSVHVRVQSCGPNLCGVVVWANEKARRDALKGSREPLVGSTLFRDFRAEKPGVWRGKVYVPDMGKTFSGTISPIGPDQMRGSGCLLGRFVCKSQVWTRIGD